MSAVGYKAVLPELIFVQSRQSPQRIRELIEQIFNNRNKLFVLKPGENLIACTGNVRMLEIVPRWRCL